MLPDVSIQRVHSGTVPLIFGNYPSGSISPFASKPFSRKLVKAEHLPTQMGKDNGDLYVEADTKTKSSKRNIVLAGFAFEALKQHHVRQQEMRRMAGDAWVDHDYVFCTPLGTHLNPGYGVLVQLKHLLEKAGLPERRFHDLRHSAATLLLSMGIHPKVVQEILGHTEISMTMDIYSHVLPTMQRDAMDKLNQAFEALSSANKIKKEEFVYDSDNNVTQG